MIILELKNIINSKFSITQLQFKAFNYSEKHPKVKVTFSDVVRINDIVDYGPTENCSLTNSDELREEIKVSDCFISNHYMAL